jgi:hypothetical protein
VIGARTAGKSQPIFVNAVEISFKTSQGSAPLSSSLIGILHSIIKYHLEEHGFDGRRFETWIYNI